MSPYNIARGTRRWRIVHIYRTRTNRILLSAGGRKAYDYFLRNGTTGVGGCRCQYRVDERKGVDVSRPAANRVSRSSDRPRPSQRIISPQRQLIRRRDSSCTPDRDYNIILCLSARYIHCEHNACTILLFIQRVRRVLDDSGVSCALVRHDAH